MGEVDSILAGFNFTRTMMNAVPNYEDTRIYRLVGRYTAVVSPDGTFYRR
jgi:hypothetical protein